MLFSALRIEEDILPWRLLCIGNIHAASRNIDIGGGLTPKLLCKQKGILLADVIDTPHTPTLITCSSKALQPDIALCTGAWYARGFRGLLQDEMSALYWVIRRIILMSY